MKQVINLVLTAFLFCFVSNSTHAQSNGFELIKGLELMDLIYQQLETHYVDEPKPGKLSKVGGVVSPTTLIV